MAVMDLGRAMTGFFFNNALLFGGWARNVRLDVDAGGWITSVTTASSPDHADFRSPLAVPGVPNGHSHAFQRAMAGLTEAKGPADDGFWAWRDLMYRFVETLTPDDLRAVATQAYVEMLEAGFTAVAEFHYLHHAPDHSQYDDIGEMSGAIIQAARHTGIGLTFLPVFYESAGFGGVTPSGAQGRFLTTPESYGRLLERVLVMLRELPHAVLGLAPHSLRAVTPAGLRQILSLPCAGPVHLHIAEQLREVEDCLAWSGARPLSWLFDNAAVDERWCLVHATHLDRAEISQFANSGAVAGLCPITEANLGDGIFEAVSFLEQGGSITIGSDSNIFIGLAEELRLLEYSQRLRDRGRARLAGTGASNGRALYDHVLKGGARAGGRRTGRMAPGYRADFVALDQNHPGLLRRAGDGWLDGWIFAADNRAVQDVWVGGRQVVRDGRHFARETIARDFSKTLSRLLA